MPPQHPSEDSPTDHAIRDVLAAHFGKRYRVHREIGRGGMSSVFLATDQRHGRSVALKVLHPVVTTSVGAERFHREVMMTARLSHRHIVPVYDSGDAEGLLYYIMPFIAGDTVSSRIQSSGAFGWGEAVRIASEVAEALAYAHESGVVHRDIKPGNILLTAGDHACVADFGLLHLLRETTNVRLTSTGMVLGSPLYMSPEQVTDTGEITGRADVYSLACTLYEMVTALPLFTGRTAEVVMRRHVSGSVSVAGDLGVGAPRALVDAISLALSKNPDDRPDAATFAVMMTDISKLPPSSGFAASRARKRQLPASTAAAGDSRSHVERLVRGRRVTMKPWSALAVLLVVLATMLLWREAEMGNVARGLFRTGVGSASTAAGLPDFHPAKIAVLYFNDHTGDPRFAYLSSALTDAVIGALTRVDRIEVISLNGVERLQGSALPIRAIANELRVGSMVDGSISRAGDSIRVTVHLIDALTGHQRDSREIVVPQADVVGLRDGLIDEVVATLRRFLGQEIRYREIRGGTDDPEAFQLFWKARTLRREVRSVNRGDPVAARRMLTEADALLATAARRDPEWADIMIERGWVHRDLARLDGALPGQYGRGSGAQALARAQHAVDRAPENAAALELRGTVRQEYARTLDGPARVAMERAAEQDLRKAVDLDDSRAGAYAQLSTLLADAGHFAEAEWAVLRALEADAFLEDAAKVASSLFYTAIEHGPTAEAQRYCVEGHERYPTVPSLIACRLFLLASFPDVPADVDEALRLADNFAEASVVNERASTKALGTMFAAQVAARAGQHARALDLIAAARGDTALDWLSYNEAHARLQMGQSVEAVALLARYLRYDPDTAYIAKDWWFEPLHTDSLFRKLVDQTR
jgi:serine/threonine-protein kinase